MSENLLELDKRDVCVHDWRSYPCIDLRNHGRYMPPVWECAGCGLTLGDGSYRIERAGLPAIGKGLRRLDQ